MSIEQPRTEEVGTAAPVDAGGTGPEADRRPLPATSPDELVVRLESLRRPDQKAASATSILDALRIGEGFTFQITDVHRAALVLNELDPRWEARLQVVSRGLRMRGFHRSLADQLILEARQKLGYPPNEDDPDGHAEAVLRWIRSSMIARADAKATSPAQILVTLLRDRDAKYFRDGALLLLDAVNSDNLNFTAADFGASVVDLVARGRAGRRATLSALALLQPIRGENGRLQGQVKTVTDEIGAVRRRERHLDIQLASATSEVSRLHGELASASSRIAQLEQELTRARELAVHREREVSIGASGDVARLRRRVREVITRNAEEIRRYLERKTPNTSAALARLGNLDALARELEERSS